ncbi:MAG: glycosyltransferase [Lentisphaeraceae bacterium]|nr:glycosyltransferase [Lentisphaeraceae bacterium]
MYDPKHISLYVPCYNANTTIERCIDSLLTQNLQVGSLFVVNDGSTQPLPALPAQVIDHPENLGLASARNTALAHCQTPLIASVDSDVFVEKDWLEILLNKMNTSQVSGVAGRLDEFYTEDLGDLWRARHMAQHWGDEAQINPRFLYGANTLMKADALRKVGGFDTLCRTNNEDRTMCEALYGLGEDLAYEPQAQCWHLRHDSMFTILSSYWGWHHAKGIKEGDYNSLDGVMSRIERVNIGIATYRHNLDVMENNQDFAFLDQLIPFVFAHKDLKLYATRSNSQPLSIFELLKMCGLEADLVAPFLPDFIEMSNRSVEYEQVFMKAFESFKVQTNFNSEKMNSWLLKKSGLTGCNS